MFPRPSSLPSLGRVRLFLAVLPVEAARAEKAFAPIPPPARPAAFPLATDVDSGGTPGGMGRPVDQMHRPAGQPARTVISCGEGRIRESDQDPARFPARLDDAAATAQGAQPKQATA